MNANTELVETVSETPFQVSWLRECVRDLRSPLTLVFDRAGNRLGACRAEELSNQPVGGLEVFGNLPAMFPEWLGDRTFLGRHQTRFPYVGGAMARGIASVELVRTLSQHGMLGFFGAAGLSLERIEEAIHQLKRSLDPAGLPWGMNFIHSPHDPSLEQGTIDLYLREGVQRIEAAAFMDMSPTVVQFACKGLTRDAQGRIQRNRFVFGKVSRPEVAEGFLSPAPQAILDRLVQDGKLTREEAELASQIPVSEDLTVESDSGGHTDNRPLGPLFSAIARLRDEIGSRFAYARPPRLGAAGGMGTPEAVASAFSLGAAYVCVGSVHQSCVESGVSDQVKAMLAEAGLADCAMTACADMFEQGVKVQVLKRGTMMPQRGNQLFQIYRRYSSLEAIPTQEREHLEKMVFRKSLDAVWEETRDFFSRVKPSEVQRADSDPKHRMALVFRWYLAKSSRWPIDGEPSRVHDYQIWCGSAMGAFNEWVKGSFLETPSQRSVAQVALNLMEGAAYVSRCHQLRSYGLRLPNSLSMYFPERLGIELVQH